MRAQALFVAILVLLALSGVVHSRRHHEGKRASHHHGNAKTVKYTEVEGAGEDYYEDSEAAQHEHGAEMHDGIDVSIMDTSVDVGQPHPGALAKAARFSSHNVDRDGINGEVPPVPTNSAEEDTAQSETGSESGDPQVNERFGVSVDPGMRVDMGSIWPHWSQMAALSGGTGFRRYTRDIRFTRNFMASPVVQVGLRAVNIFPAYDQRINAYASNVNANGFRLTIETWGNSKVITAGASWTAYGPDRDAYNTHRKEMKLKGWLAAQLPIRSKETEKMMKKVLVFKKYMRKVYEALDKKMAKMRKMREKLENDYRKSRNFRSGVIPQIKSTIANMQKMRVLLEQKMREVWAREYAKLVKMRSTIKTLKANNANLRMRVKQMKDHHQKLFTQVSYEFKELWHYQHVSAAILDNMETLREKVGETVQSTKNAHPNVHCKCHSKNAETGTIDLAELPAGIPIPTNSGSGMDPGKVCICQSTKTGAQGEVNGGNGDSNGVNGNPLAVLQSS